MLNIVRHDLGFHESKARFPAKGTCLAIYSRTVNAQADLAETLKDHFPWAAMWEAQLRELFAAYVETKQSQNVLDYDDLLLYSAARASTISSSTSIRTPTGCNRRSCSP